jgi:hypothetical protein
MRTSTLILATFMAAGAPMLVTVAHAQVTRSEEMPGNNPTKFYSTNQRTYVQGYVRNRTVPSITYDGQIAIGTQLPSSYSYYDVEGEPELRGYRYGRFNNRYVVIDSTGRVVDVIE